jgi:hypothetical protein
MGEDLSLGDSVGERAGGRSVLSARITIRIASP